MEITLPVRKPRENIIPWPPPSPSLRPALSGRPGPESIPYEIFTRIIEHMMNDIVAFIEAKARVVCSIDFARHPARNHMRLKAPGTDDDDSTPPKLKFTIRNMVTQKKRYRLLCVPLGINQATRRMVHRIFFPFKFQIPGLSPSDIDYYDDAVPCLIWPEMDRFCLPSAGTEESAIRRTFRDLLLALQNPRPSDEMLLSCVQKITLRHMDYFYQEYSPFIEAMAAFPSLRSIDVALLNDYGPVVPYEPSDRNFEPLPKSHFHNKLERIECVTPMDPDRLSCWNKTEGHGFYELTRPLREKKIKIWLTTLGHAESWAELVATPDGPRLSYKTDPCICKTWAPHHMAFRYFFHDSVDLYAPQRGFFQKGFHPLGPDEKRIPRYARGGFLRPKKHFATIRDRRLKSRDKMPYIPWDITILIIGVLIEEGVSYMSSEEPLCLRLHCREKPYVFWPGPCGDILSFRLYTQQEHLHDNALAQKNRYRALRIPLSICQETRRLVHRRVLQANVQIITPTLFIPRHWFLHAHCGAPEFDENIRFLIFPERDVLSIEGADDWSAESNFMHAVKYPTPGDRRVLKWVRSVHRDREKGSPNNEKWDKIEAAWKKMKD